MSQGFSAATFVPSVPPPSGMPASRSFRHGGPSGVAPAVPVYCQPWTLSVIPSAFTRAMFASLIEFTWASDQRRSSIGAIAAAASYAARCWSFSAGRSECCVIDHPCSATKCVAPAKSTPPPPIRSPTPTNFQKSSPSRSMLLRIRARMTSAVGDGSSPLHRYGRWRTFSVPARHSSSAYVNAPSPTLLMPPWSETVVRPSPAAKSISSAVPRRLSSSVCTDTSAAWALPVAAMLPSAATVTPLLAKNCVPALFVTPAGDPPPVWDR
jgi:hypothetical protein